MGEGQLGHRFRPLNVRVFPTVQRYFVIVALNRLLFSHGAGQVCCPILRSHLFLEGSSRDTKEGLIDVFARLRGCLIVANALELSGHLKCFLILDFAVFNIIKFGAYEHDVVLSFNRAFFFENVDILVYIL